MALGRGLGVPLDVVDLADWKSVAHCLWIGLDLGQVAYLVHHFLVRVFLVNGEEFVGVVHPRVVFDLVLHLVHVLLLQYDVLGAEQVLQELLLDVVRVLRVDQLAVVNVLGLGLHALAFFDYRRVK